MTTRPHRQPSPAGLSARIALPLLALLSIGTVGLWVTAEPGRPPEPTPPETPLSTLEHACPTQSGAEPDVLGRREEAAARAMMPRRPFDPADGVRAVRSLSTAAACYRASGRAQTAQRIEREAEAWKREVERDYRAHLLGLRRAADQGRHADALASVRALRSLLTGATGPFVDHLRAREIELRAKTKDDS